MSRFVKTTVVCASCKAERKEANHWFVVDTLFTGGSPGRRLYEVWKFRPDAELGNCEYPVCGESCLHKIEAKIIAGVEI